MDISSLLETFRKIVGHTISTKTLLKTLHENDLNLEKSINSFFENNNQIKKEFFQNSKKKEDDSLENYQKTYPIFIGKTNILGSSTKNQILDSSKEKIVYLHLEKNPFEKKVEIIRIVYNNREIGKLNVEYTEILAPMLKNNLIKLEAFFPGKNDSLNIFSIILLEIKVILVVTFSDKIE